MTRQGYRTSSEHVATVAGWRVFRDRMGAQVTWSISADTEDGFTLAVYRNLGRKSDAVAKAKGTPFPPLSTLTPEMRAAQERNRFIFAK